MKGHLLKFTLCSIASATMLSAGFMLDHCGGFALMALVPLLWMDREADRIGARHFWIWHYLTFVLWNAITTFWVCNATVGGGLFAIFANAFQMSVIWALFRLFKRRYSQGSLPYIFLATMWIAWERFYFDAEISWPWLVLGNAFARTTTFVQWYELTGLLGGSLWIWACNLGILGILCSLQEGKWKSLNIKAKTAAVLSMAALVLVPAIWSLARYAGFEEDASKGELKVCVLQPDFDPYQKFSSMSQAQQTDILVEQMQSQMPADSSASLLFIAPETFTSDVILNEPGNSATLRTIQATLQGRPNTGMLMGASAYEFFYQAKAPSYTARQLRQSGTWYEDYNIALMTDATGRCDIYKKRKLVPAVEKMPYPRFFGKIDKALGGVMGHCIGQAEADVLLHHGGESDVKLGCAVCYESIYPEHVAQYVQKGAEALCVITNDAWWGDTPGYVQHLNYARLRAIETRRDIARSANTGISAFINQRGDIVSETSWWQRETLPGSVKLSGRMTAFVKHGDIIGRLCTFVFLLLLCAFFVKAVKRD